MLRNIQVYCLTWAKLKSQSIAQSHLSHTTKHCHVKDEIVINKVNFDAANYLYLISMDFIVLVINIFKKLLWRQTFQCSC